MRIHKVPSPAISVNSEIFNKFRPEFVFPKVNRRLILVSLCLCLAILLIVHMPGSASSSIDDRPSAVLDVKNDLQQGSPDYGKITRTTLAPGAFSKTAPQNVDTYVSISPDLTWEASNNATSYEYCIDTTLNSNCDSSWVSVNANLSVTLNGLDPNSEYSWQVRAKGPSGTTYANNGAWWSFTTAPLPGSFNKSQPLHNATAVIITPTLTWLSSAEAAEYEYCYDLTGNSTCDGDAWISVGLNTSVTLNEQLVANTPYYWQVRAISPGGITEANNSTWWKFTTALKPGAFNKTLPLNNATNVSVTPTLTWAASLRATSYEYCYDETADSACDNNWTSTGTDTQVVLSGLAPGKNYYWQVRANGDGGTTYANAGTWWKFTTAQLPAAFNKSDPVDNAIDETLNPTLIWTSSNNFTNYEYCIDVTDDSNCDGAWISTGTDTNIALSGLIRDTEYFWQVRANGLGGSIYANTNTWWNFRTAPLPAAFSKTLPGNDATNVSINPTLAWAASSHVTSYEYCIDQTNNSSCDSGWVNTAANTTVNITGLVQNNAYYWQVRAVGAGGTTYANGSSWWEFTTAQPPVAFNKTSPSNDASGIPINTTLTWAASNNATSYAYCFDTTDNSACDGDAWVSVGTALTVNIITLNPGTNYYWHIRADGPGGTTYANNNTWWKFSTAAQPSTFHKITPATNTVDVSLTPTLSWAASSGFTSYEYCIDATNDGNCDGNNWVNTGTATDVAIPSELIPNINYYWQVRAIGPGGTTSADGNTWWQFTTVPRPAAFNKTLPLNNATNVSLSLTLTWNDSDHVTRYEYCLDTSSNNQCDADNWQSAGLSTSARLNGLNVNTTYYWQVRAVGSGGSTEANTGLWWHFTTQAVYKVWLPQIMKPYPPASYTPTLNVIDNAAGTGEYSVSWSANPVSPTYILEEATDELFTDATEAYTGSATSTLISDRGPTRYYYRVKASNTWGDSSWSNVQSVDVFWENEPNDPYTEAGGPLISGVNYYGYPNDAKDFFKFYVPSAGAITINLTNHTGGGVQLQLFFQQVDVAHRVAYDLSAPYRINYNGQPGWYWIYIYTASGYNSTTPYTLQVTYPPGSLTTSESTTPLEPPVAEERDFPAAP